MSTTLDCRDQAAALDAYADHLIAEIRAEYDRYGLDVSFIEQMLGEDFNSLVPVELTTSSNAFDYVLGFVTARVLSAFPTSN